MSNSLELVVEQIDQLIIKSSLELNIEKSEILAQVIKSCLLSDDENPNHINGIELFQRCDKCLSLSLLDEAEQDINSHLNVDF